MYKGTLVLPDSKADFVRRKVRHVLLECRRDGPEAVRSGLWQAMVDLSPEATPFLRLLSATDWGLLLCGEDGLTAEAVADTPPVQPLPQAEPHPGLAASGRGAVQPGKPPPLPRLLGGTLAAPRGPPRGLRDWCAVPAMLRGPPRCPHVL